MTRLLYPVPLPAPSRIQLSGSRFHYVVRVRRLRVGDSLEVFDGKGRSFAARLCTLGDEHAEVELGPSATSQPIRSIALIQGIPKLEKMEWILQKGTELGAAAFAPVFTQRSIRPSPGSKGFSMHRLRRWQRIVEEAARQCGRTDVPHLAAPSPLLDAVRQRDPHTDLLLLNESERDQTLAEAFSCLKSGTSIALVVGSEGGFDADEIGSLVALGASSVRLGSRILRTETASLAALAILLHLDGQLG